MDTLMTDNYPFGLDIEDTARVTGFVQSPEGIEMTGGVNDWRQPVRPDAHLVNHIDPSVVIDCPDVRIGVGVTIERGTRIKADKLRIGDFSRIGDHVTLIAPEITIGDYVRMSAQTYGGGRKALSIGHNCYFGRGVYLDSNGQLTIEDNVAFGAYSQVWSHCEFGDTVYGLNPVWNTERAVTIRKDAWCIGRVVVSSASEIGERALVLNESNVCCDIPADTTWAGSPAKDMTAKFGRQFEELSIDERRARLKSEIKRFEAAYPQYADILFYGLRTDFYRGLERGDTVFFADTRTYTKRRTAAEVAFLRWTKAKFTPVEDTE